MIKIAGVLTDAPDLFARWFGEANTTYGEIISAIAMAEADDTISEIIFHVTSPGGEASADFLDAMVAMAATTKPTKTIVGNMAASAAFGLISGTDKVFVQNEMSAVGSVGVVFTTFVSDFIVEVTSTNAPKKRPDPTTEKGKADIREFIDQIEKVFIDNIAEGRNVTSEKVKANFGQGGLMLATEALKRNMIDGINTDLSSGNNASGDDGNKVDAKEKKPPQGQNKGAIKMDLEKLKAEHPNVFAEAVAEGVAEGVKKERDRVVAHINMGEAADAMDIATKAIQDGDEFSMTIQSQYMAATLNKNDSDDRTKDEIEAAAAADKANAADKADANTKNDEVLDLVGAEMFGEDE